MLENKGKNKILVGNIKMNLVTKLERENYVNSLRENLEKYKSDDVEIIICPPSVHLEYFESSLKDTGVKLGSQNAHWLNRGAYTGEVSVDMLKDLGVSYVIVGHSERRMFFGETDEFVNLKIKATLNSGISPIFCFGETREERDMGMTKDVVLKQISNGMKDVTGEDVEKVIFAYEPVWAIGSGNIPAADEIMEVGILTRNIISKAYGAEISKKINILYGGSVNAKIIEQTCVETKLDGALVGGDSLVPKNFLELSGFLRK